MHDVGTLEKWFAIGWLAAVLLGCGDDDETGDDGSSAPTSVNDASSTASGTSEGSSGENASVTGSSSQSDDASATDEDTANGEADSGSLCVCTDDLSACDSDFTPGGDCGRASQDRCCHSDGPYTCICPFAPPCEWNKDECR
jgi:hypothetical protein